MDGGEVACDDRLVHAGGGPLIALLDDDYGEQWECTGIAARWTPGGGWCDPY